MAGYSGTPLAAKLGIKPGLVVAVLGAPDGFRELLAPVPEGVTFRTRAQGRLDLIVCFVTARRELERRMGRLATAFEPDGALWIAWPKRASGVPSDVSEDVVRALALAAGLVDNKVAAIDDTWSGLRLVVRLRDRPGRVL